MKSHYAGLFGLALTGMFALSANAADMGPTWAGYKDVPYAAVTWTGFHVGVNGGYASSQDSQLGYADSTVPVTYGGVSSAGGFGGGQIGYDWQGLLGYRPLVLGVEADIQVSSAQGRSADLPVTSTNRGSKISVPSAAELAMRQTAPLFTSPAASLTAV